VARPAPATDRTITILNFLAERPDESFTLSELSRRLGIAKGTAHPQVAALCAAGYLLRHPVTKTIMLGPALIGLGNAAASGRSELVEYARDEMGRLAADLDLQCVASAIMGEEMVLLARVGHIGALGLHVGLGRVPLVPPFGTVFLAWDSPDAIDGWLHRLDRGLSEVELARYRQAVATVRRRGYSVSTRPLDETGDHGESALLELGGAARSELSMIAAPVFGADGSVVLALTLVGMSAELDESAIPGIGSRLVEVTTRLTAAFHGIVPLSDLVAKS
jgi:DNA-binding IclR family transcriptional regulator